MSLLNSWSVSRRLTLAFGALSAIVLAVAVMGYSGIGSVAGLAQDIVSVESVMAIGSKDLQSAVLNLRRYEKDTFLNIDDNAKSADYLSKWKKERELLETTWLRLEQQSTILEERAQLERGRAHLDAYSKGFEGVVAGIQGKSIMTAEVANLSMVPFKDAVRSLEGMTDEIAARHRKRMDGALEQINDRRRQVVTALLLFVALGVPVLVFAMMLARSLSSQIRRLAQVFPRIASGDMAGAADDLKVLREGEVEGSHSEIAALTAAAREMTEGLRVGLSRSLRDGVVQLSASIAQIGATSKQYAATAGEQAASVAQISTTIEEIRQTSQTAAQSAREVAESAEEAAQGGQDGRERLLEAVATMRTINDRVQAIAGQILQLSEQTAQIGTIVDAVNDLAEQSNLLAVNASIEAAKAGDQGRGFAVVASEVRSLAEQSKRATQQIRGILVDIQKATQSAVMATEEGTKRADDGGRSVDAVRVVVENLAAVLEESSGKARQIAGAATQQASGIAQIATAMENLATAGRDNAKGVKQLEQSVLDLDKLAGALKATSARL
jgi:methyl-accepting chemotaxis protein